MMMLLAGTPALAAPVLTSPFLTPVPVTIDTLALPDIEIPPIVIQMPATFMHAVVTEVALDVIEIFEI
jgi:hypothetical protein